MYTSLWKESVKDPEEKKQLIWVVMSIFSEGFRHLVGLPVNPPPLWLIERMPLQVINGKWRLSKMESQPRHMFTYFLRCFHHLYMLPINLNLTPIQTIFLQHFLFSFFWFKRLTLNTMLPSNRKMCVMHRPLICQCGRWWWAQLPGLLYSCPSHLPKKYFPSTTHTLKSEYFW